MIRVLVAGDAQQAARILADAGFEVVYTGPTELAGIAATAIQEAVDCVVMWGADAALGIDTPTVCTTTNDALVARVLAAARHA